MQTRQLTRVVTNPKNVGTNPNRAMGHDTSKLTPTGNLSSFGETFIHTTVNPNLRDTSEKNGGSGSFFSSIPSVLIESIVGGMHDYCDGVMVTLSVASYILMLPRKLVSAAKDDKRKVCAAIEITKKVTTARFVTMYMLMLPIQVLSCSYTLSTLCCQKTLTTAKDDTKLVNVVHFFFQYLDIKEKVLRNEEDKEVCEN
ncbi:hypothetical protein Tco_0890258 [Tanacetum coccineum]|uniref:Uncharacterized protein n=1 Tax=Tanacetum coccineum TaxID=301880 RepID=A0ABQ5BZY9_9ASTR